MKDIERLARVMYCDTCDAPAKSWDTANDLTRGIYIGNARAVLRAMRNPSEGMTKAGGQAIAGCPHDKGFALVSWQAMIDHMLSEGGE